MKTFLKAVVQSFYDAAFYRDLARKGRGVGLGFIILAAFLSLVPLARTDNADAFFDNKKEIFAALPTLTLQNGELTSDTPTPLTFDLLKAEQGGPLRIVIDLETDMTATEALKTRMAADHIFLLVGKTAMAIYDPAKTQLNLTSFAQSKDRTFTPSDWRSLNEMTDLFFGSGFMAMLLGFGFFFHLGTAALGGALLRVLSPHVATTLDFKASMRLAAAAKVPVGIVALLVTPYPPLQALLWFGFAAFGLLAQRAKAVGNGPEIS